MDAVNVVNLAFPDYPARGFTNGWEIRGDASVYGTHNAVDDCGHLGIAANNWIP
jgi:hypothetical protein